MGAQCNDAHAQRQRPLDRGSPQCKYYGSVKHNDISVLINDTIADRQSNNARCIRVELCRCRRKTYYIIIIIVPSISKKEVYLYFTSWQISAGILSTTDH